MKCAHQGCKHTKIVAHVEGKPYCNSHYKNIREKLRAELTIELIQQLDVVLESNPDLKDKFTGLDRLRRLYLALRPKPEDRDTREGARVQALEAELAEMREALSKIQKYLPKR